MNKNLSHLGNTNGMFGKHHTKKTKQIISQKAIKRLKDPTKHPNYKHGKLINNKICKICGKKISKSASHCRSCATKIQVKNPKNHPSWLGGRIYSYGYILIYAPKHPYATRKYIGEHRLVMEKHLKRYLMKGEIVHHINGIRDDNKIENLMLFKSNSEHRTFHLNLFKFIIKNYFNIVLKYIQWWNKQKDNSNE